MNFTLAQSATKRESQLQSTGSSKKAAEQKAKSGKVETFECILRLHKAQQREQVNYDRLETVRKQRNRRLSLEKVLIKESYLLRTFDAIAGIVPNGLH